MLDQSALQLRSKMIDRELIKDKSLVRILPQQATFHVNRQETENYNIGDNNDGQSFPNGILQRTEAIIQELEENENTVRALSQNYSNYHEKNMYHELRNLTFAVQTLSNRIREFEDFMSSTQTLNELATSLLHQSERQQVPQNPLSSSKTKTIADKILACVNDPAFVNTLLPSEMLKVIQLPAVTVEEIENVAQNLRDDPNYINILIMALRQIVQLEPLGTINDLNGIVRVLHQSIGEEKVSDRYRPSTKSKQQKCFQKELLLFFDAVMNSIYCNLAVLKKGHNKKNLEK